MTWMGRRRKPPGAEAAHLPPLFNLRRGSRTLGVDSSLRRPSTVDAPRRRGSAHEERTGRKWATR
nr:MAG TPA: hypothetical protein [Caudoviricetes sp.]